MTSLHMLPANDPASVSSLLARSRESFLRVRKDRLAVGPFRVKPERRYDADRLLRDLASIREAGRDPRVLAARLADGADEREELRRMGWTDERLASAQEGLRDDLQGRVHPPLRPPLIAGGGPGKGRAPSQSRRPLAATPLVDAPPAVVASAVEGRRLIADDLSTLTGSGGPQRASGFALRHFASEWWLCRNVGGRWTNTGYAARGGRWWRWAKDRLVETNLPAPSVQRRRAHGLVASAGSDRSIYGLLPPVGASFGPSRATTPSGANRDAPGGR